MIWFVFRRAKLVNQYNLCVLELVFYLDLAHTIENFPLRLSEKHFDNFILYMVHPPQRTESAETRKELIIGWEMWVVFESAELFSLRR